MRGGGRDFVGIPTSAEFQRLTTINRLIFTHRRNNILLLAVDAALAEFEAHGQIPYTGVGLEPAVVTENHNYITTVLLLKVAIRAQMWIESKLGGDSTRRPVVMCLYQQCISNLAADPLYAFGRPAAAMDITSAGLKRVLANTRLANMKTQLRRIGVVGPGKALDSGYWLETNFHGLNPGHNMGQGERLAFEGSGAQFAMHHVRGGGGAGGGGAGGGGAGGGGAGGGGAGGGGRAEIAYIEAQDREPYQIHLIDGTVHRKLSGDAIPMRVESINGKILVMDLAGRFYSTFGDQAPGGRSWHHSSMLAGQPVGFAGGIVVQDGVITEIDNMSGHYKPSPKYMVDALARLAAASVNLDEVHITLAFPVPGVDEGMRVQVFNSGSKYLRLRGMLRPDVDTAPEHE
jgi:uncharacterized membrane protein YgcG